MTEVRDILINRLWAGRDPLANAPRYLERADPQGWGANHPYLTDMISELRPQLVVEVGVWKGASTLVMAERMQRLGIPGVVLAVDTWLGSWDIWLQPNWFADLHIEDGYPTLYQTFLGNVATAGLADYVVPLPLDSQSAAQLLRHCGIGQVDLVHIDAGHDYDAVASCLRAWWPMVRRGGVLIGDDYCPDSGAWPDVVKCFDDYFGRERIESKTHKCLIRQK